MKSRIGYNLAFSFYIAIILAAVTLTIANGELFIFPWIDRLYYILLPPSIITGFYLIRHASINPLREGSILNPYRTGSLMLPFLSGVFLGFARVMLNDILSIQPSGVRDFADLSTYLAQGLMGGIIINFFIMTLLVALICRKTTYVSFPAVPFWTLAILLSFLEPFFILRGYLAAGLITNFAQAIFTFEIIYLINIAAFMFFRYRGWIPALLIRFAESACFTLMFLFTTWIN
ncbi:MAG: hypothetical protein R2744_13140 [Bacteroidales bacterium]